VTLHDPNDVSLDPVLLQECAYARLRTTAAALLCGAFAFGVVVGFAIGWVAR